MTEKRFTKYVPDSYGYTYITTIIDNKKNKQTGNTDEIVDMLNELADENEQLKQQREELFIRERDTKNEWRELKKENKQLKEEIKDLNDLLARYEEKELQKE